MHGKISKNFFTDLLDQNQEVYHDSNHSLTFRLFELFGLLASSFTSQYLLGVLYKIYQQIWNIHQLNETSLNKHQYKNDGYQ